MNQLIPPAFKHILSDPSIKMSVLWLPTDRPGQCPNCNDTRIVTMFAGYQGPFTRLPFAPKPPRCTAFYNGSWWIGEHFTSVCPMCENQAVAEEKYVARPATVQLSKHLQSPQQKHRRTAEEDEQAHARAEAITAELATMPAPAGEGPENWWNQDEHNHAWNTGEEG